ncbi:vasculin-like protein 1 isoform X2 [Tubulanus polymorphus]|uniref:vasculin-like protein 1 isoform X2 n=1 Tax=Tubulanus polymorphus TaxID=672921 RepID=UPI003DA57A5F
MAANRAPKNDFAPAWLKIPTDGKSTNGCKPETKAIKDEQRIRHDSGNNDRRRGQQQRHRHNSVEDDYFNHYPYGYFPAYGSFDKYGNHYRSQPMLYRPTFRDGKYQHPNARFSQVPMTPGAPLPYYEYPYEFYDANYYSPYVRSNNSRHHGSRDKNNDKKNGKLDDQDFPSLNGEGKDKKETKEESRGKSAGVWDNPPKVTSSSSPKRQLDSCSPDTQRKESLPESKSSIYKALVPNKSGHNRKQPRINGFSGREHVNGTSSPSAHKGGKENREMKESLSPTPAVDILSTRFVTQPKNIGDKKSEFLKALRKEGCDINSNKKIQQNGDSLNGDAEDLSEKVDHLKIGPSCLLSSSLEAEQRLLREMGWNEADDEEYVITEDDMKEFQNLSKQVKEQQQHNKFEMMKPSVTPSWSPQHISYLPPAVDPADDDTSSLDSDSDIN